MRKWKQRLIMLLCAALLAPSLLLALPMFETEASAAGGAISWDGSVMDRKAAHPTMTAKVIVEQGQKFILGDWIAIYSGKNYTKKTAYETKGVKYSTSNKKVAAITKKGVVNTKKKGTTVIKVKYGSETLTCTMKVVKKKSLTKKLKNSDKVNSYLAKVMKYRDSKINDKNFDELYTLAKKVNDKCDGDFCSSYQKCSMKHQYGVICYPKAKNWVDQVKGEVAMPQYLSYMRVREKMATFLNKAKAPSFANTTVEVDVATGMGTIKLDKPLTTAQYLRIVEKDAMRLASAYTYYGSYFTGEGYLMTAGDKREVETDIRDEKNTGYITTFTVAKNATEIPVMVTDARVGTMKDNNRFTPFSGITVVIKGTDTTADTDTPAGTTAANN